MKNTLHVAGLTVQVSRKNIKTLRLSVHPPYGDVLMSVPIYATENDVKTMIVSKFKWIEKQKEKVQNLPPEVEKKYVSGESHYFRGMKYTLKVVEHFGKNRVSISNDGLLSLYVNPESTLEIKHKLLTDWYRQQLKLSIESLLIKWQPIVGKQVNFYGVKKMKTRWGSCNIAKARIWLNLELIKKSPECLEYVLVHELVHLHERYHNHNFKSLMTKYLPDWKQKEATLTSEAYY